MAKAFRAYLTDNDEEHVYFIRCIRNLHDPDVMDQVRLALMGWEVRELEIAGYNFMGDDNGFWPEPGSPVWSLKAILGLQPPDNEVAVQKIALYTNYNHNYIMFHGENEKAEKVDNSDEDVSPDTDYRSLSHGAKGWDATPDKDIIDPSAQDVVGEKGVTSFLALLDKERNTREEERKKFEVEPQLTEAFVTSHIALTDVLGPTKKGYYLVERNKRDPDIMEIRGPLPKQPANYEFVADLVVDGGTLEVLEGNRVKLVGHDSDFRFTGDRDVIGEDTRYSVDVTNQDSGAVHNVVVFAMSETDARDRAVDLVSKRESVNSDQLLAADPKAVK